MGRHDLHAAQLVHHCALAFTCSLDRGVRFSSLSSTSSTEVGLEPNFETERPRIEDQATDRRSDLVLFLAILKFELRIQKSYSNFIFRSKNPVQASPSTRYLLFLPARLHSF